MFDRTDRCDLEALLIPSVVGEDSFVGMAGGGIPTRTFGGLFAAHALAAAASTVDRLVCHSMHLLFLRPGDAEVATRILVDRLRDGGRFASRQVRIEQKGAELVRGFLSFHLGDTGPAHAICPPQAPLPEDLIDQRTIRRESANDLGRAAKDSIVETVLDLRPVEMRADRSNGIEGRRMLWFRARTPPGPNAQASYALMAFASDVGLVHTGLMVHNELGRGSPLNATSLDHAIWFHREVKADDWMLFVQSSPVMAGGRGLTGGAIFDRGGVLIASVAQEILARDRRA